MRIQRLRILLPPRLRHTASDAARAIAGEIATTLSAQGVAPEHLTVRIDGGGRPTPLLATEAGAAAGRAVTPSFGVGGKTWR